MMAEVVINDDLGGTETGPVEESEHAAAVAEGAAEVHSENAEQAASEAKSAAEIAATGAQSAAVNTEEALEAAEVAKDSAAVALAAQQAIVQAVNSQTEMLSSLLEEFRTSVRKPTEPEKPKESRKPDTPPASRKRSFADRYYGR